MAKIAVCLIAKDEGRYLLEWMAYNLVLGFDEILIYDNDSVDGTRRLVEQASETDRRIRYVPWPSVSGVAPQFTAYNHALKNTDADWIAFIDADEFIVLREVDTIGEFLAGFDETAGAVCLNWRVFGSSGHTAYADDLVIRRFTRCARSYRHLVKSIVRRSCVVRMGVHRGRLSSGKYFHASGAPVSPRAKMFPSRHPASINHYIVKSAEEHRNKIARGRANSPDRHAKPHGGHFAINDRNDVEDLTIARFIPALEIEMARLLQPPGAWHRVKSLFRTALGTVRPISQGVASSFVTRYRHETGRPPLRKKGAFTAAERQRRRRARLRKEA